MSEQNKALVKRWFEEVWNQGRESNSIRRRVMRDKLARRTPGEGNSLDVASRVMHPDPIQVSRRKFR